MKEFAAFVHKHKKKDVIELYDIEATFNKYANDNGNDMNKRVPFDVAEKLLLVRLMSF